MAEIKKKQANIEKIICPYCFHEFSHEQVVFRANKKIEKEDTYGMVADEDTMPSSGTVDVDDYFRPFDPEDAMGSDDLKLDLALADFWRNRGGIAAYPQRWEYPHIDPADPDRFHAMIHHNCSIAGQRVGADGFVRDSDGFVQRVVDVKSDPTEPVDRLCPNCHNPLSLQEYGKYPIYFISVVGVTNAGKTVFLTELLTTFSEVMKGTGFRLSAHNLGNVGRAIHPTRPLPEATDDKVMRPPLIAQLTKDNPLPGEPNGITMVFYDIAGENCVNDDGDADEAHARATIGNFIKHCDALIFLVDPEQLPCFAEGDRENVGEIAQVVDVMNSIRQGKAEDPHWTYAPVAVTISKSDKLSGTANVPADSILVCDTKTEEKGYDREDGIAVDRVLTELLTLDAGAEVSHLDAFRLRRYFAVSAITCGVSSHFEKYENDYILDEENKIKFDVVHKWLKNWNRRTPENRAHYAASPIRRKDGTPVSFDYSVTVTEKIGNEIETDIFANGTGGNPGFNLSVGDVLSGVNLIGYPRANPNPCRIDDPLKWILWQLELMGPYPVLQPTPKKRILESNKSYERRVLEVEEANEYDKKNWYGRPTDEV